MKLQRSILFVKKNLKGNMLKIKNIVKWETSHYTGEYRGVSYGIRNLKYCATKEWI